MKIKKLIAILIVLLFLSNTIMPTTLAVQSEITKQNPVNEESKTIPDDKQVTTTVSEPATDEEVQFASENLKNYILNNYDYNSDSTITRTEMEQIQELTLECFEEGESINLQGLEYAKNLKKLKISEEIKEIQSESNKLVFQNITKLEELDIKLPGGLNSSWTNYDYTTVADVLNNLTNLKILKIRNADLSKIDFNIFKNLEELTLDCSRINNIEQLEPLTNLKYFDYNNVSYHFNSSELDKLGSQFPNLEYLKLSGENITDIQFVSKLTKLKTLDLILNNIEDISPIENLKELEKLYLSLNDIINIEPITKLENLKELEIFGNEIIDISPLENMIKSGVKVDIKSQNGNMATETLQFGATKEIETPQIISSAFDPNSIFYNQNYTLEIEVDDKSIVEATTDTNKTKLILNAKNKMGETRVILKLNSTSSDAYCASSEIQLDVSVEEPGDNKEEINISNNELKNYLLKNYDYDSDGKITEFDMLQIDSMTAELGPNIQSNEDIQVLGVAKNLKNIDLKVNDGAGNPNEFDWSPLANLEYIENLTIDGDTERPDFIKEFKNIKNLSLEGNNISDISPLAELTELQVLYLGFNQIKDISPLAGLSKLELLYLDGNKIEDVSPLEKITNLKRLYITMNQIEDISPLTNLKALERLNVSKNKIQDFSCWQDFNETIQKEIVVNNQIIEINVEGDKIVGEQFVVDLPPLCNQFDAQGKIEAVQDEHSKITINGMQATIEPLKINDTGAQTTAIKINGGKLNETIITYKYKAVLNDKEINIPDSNLKNALLKGYDINEDGKITESDLNNLETLYLQNCNIQELTGLENAKNLKIIILDNNKISDLTPIKEILSKDIQMVSLTNNYIEDLSDLEGIKFGNIDLSNNYIDFSENSTNLKIVQDTVKKQAQKEYRENPELAEWSTEEEYMEREIERVIGYYMIQNYGTPQEREEPLEFEEPLKNKLIEVGADVNNDGIITKGELSDFKLDSYFSILDLSGLQITNIENLKYLNNIAYIDLSYNNIEDISPLQECKRLRSINLNNNKIKDISPVQGFYNTYELYLAHNQIEDISSLGDIRYANAVYGYDGYFAGGKEPYRLLDIDLSNNKIHDISVINKLVTLKNMNLSGNNINDISMLSSYDFEEIVKQCGIPWEGFESEPVTINLSSNYIDIQNNQTIKAKEHFEENKSTLTLDDQKQEEVPEPEKVPGVTYSGHIQDYGWEEEWRQDGATSGLVGQGKKVEAFYIKLTNTDQTARIKYQTHVQDIGWMDYVENGALSGTTGKNKKVEAIRIQLEGLAGYSVEYRSYVTGQGWLDWVSDGITSGTTGQNKKLEAVQIRIVRTENKVPVIPGVSYRGHVQDIGWQGYVTSGVTSGLVNKNKKVEAFNIQLTNVDENAHIKYQTHIQDIGWEDNWIQDGAQTGTTGKNKKIEAIKIELEGLPGYSVEYRAYVAGQGWQSWVRDGNEAGTTGQNLKLEAIQIKITPKDPNTYVPGVVYLSHIQDKGWESTWAENGTTSGLEGQGKKVEAFYIQLANADPNAHIQYRTHVQDKGWEENWAQDGAITGTTGKNKKVEAIQIKLEGLEGYSVEYRSYVAGQGWQDWVSDGIISGTTGQNLKLEAIQIRIVKTENKIPVMPGVSYRGHVQDIGWQEYVTNGLISGVEGKGLKVEAFNIRLTNVDENAHIQYQTHIQDKGWEENWIQDGAQTGTTGQNKKVEAIRIKLENLPGYSVQYRAYVAGQGWQDWVKDGEDAGTTGQNLKLEAIQIKIVKQQ